MAQDFDINEAQLAELSKYMTGEAEFDPAQIEALGGAQIPPPVAADRVQSGFQLPKEVIDAYNSGAMDEAAEAELEADVSSGAAMLPDGARLARKVSPRVAQDYASGVLPPDRKAQLEAALADGRARLPAGIQKPVDGVDEPKALPVTPDEALSQPATPGLQAALASAPQGPEATTDKKEEPGVIGNIIESVTGEQRKTVESEALPDWTDMPELNQLSLSSAAAGVGTLLTDSSAEAAQIIQSNFPGVASRQDKAGNIILKSSIDGKEYVFKPGFRGSDINRAVAQTLAYAPASRVISSAKKAAGAAAATGAAIEGAQAAAGGEFDPLRIGVDLITGGLAVPGAKIGHEVVNKLRSVFGAKTKDIYVPPKAPEGTPQRIEEDMFSSTAALILNPNQANRREFIISMGRLDPAGISVPDDLKKRYGIDIWSQIPPDVLAKDETVKNIFAAFASNSPHIQARRQQFAETVSELVDKNIRAVATDEPVKTPLSYVEGAPDIGISRSDAQEAVVNRLQSEQKEAFGYTVTDKSGDTEFVPGFTQKAYEKVIASMADRDASSPLTSARGAIENLARLEQSGQVNKAAYDRIREEIGKIDYWVRQAEYKEKGFDKFGNKKKKGVEFKAPEPITARKIQQTVIPAIDSLDNTSTDAAIKNNLGALRKAFKDDMLDLIESQGGSVDELRKADDIFKSAAQTRSDASKLIGDALTDETATAKEAMGPIDRSLKGLEKGEVGSFSKLMKMLGPDARTVIASSLDTVFSRMTTGGQRSLKRVSDFLTGVAKNGASARALEDNMTREYYELFRGIKKVVDWGEEAQRKTASSGVTYDIKSKIVEGRSFATKARLATNQVIQGALVLVAQKTGGLIGGKTGSGAGAIAGSAAGSTLRDTEIGPQSTSYAMRRLGEVLSSPEFMADLKEMVAAESVTARSAERAIKEGRAPGYTRDQLIEKWRKESQTKVGMLREKLAKTAAMKGLAKSVGVDLKKVGEYEAFVEEFLRATTMSIANLEDNE